MKLLITAILLSAALMEPAAAGANTVGKVAESNTVDKVGASTHAACPELTIRPKPGRRVQVRASGQMNPPLIKMGN
jgi:hypothetical protein